MLDSTIISVVSLYLYLYLYLYLCLYFSSFVCVSVCLCVCVCVPSQQFQSCSNCEAQQSYRPSNSANHGGILALRAHCALLLDYVPPEEPLGTPLGNSLRIR